MDLLCPIHFYLILTLQAGWGQTQNDCEGVSLDQSKWAIGYEGEMYTAKFKENQAFFSWGLTLSNGTIDSAQYIWTEGMGFVPNSFDSPQIYSTFNASEVGFISTTFGSALPLDQYLNNSQLLFTTFEINCERNIKVEACSLFLQDGVIVSIDTNANYLSNGEFDCSNNGVLFNINEKELINKETTCLSDVTWKGQEGLQCWKAPSVALQISNISSDGKVLENNQIHLTCNYDEVLPAANFSRYFVNGQWFSDSPANVTTTLEVKRDMKYISCQAITPFTEIYKETGRSQNITIDVLYGPTQVVLSILNTVEIDSNVYVNESSDINLSCKSEANPVAKCSWYLPPETLIKENQNCSMFVKFIQSGNVSCRIFNYLNTTTSEQREVIYVEPRVGNISVDFTGEHLLETSNVTLNCSVSLQNELNTSFKWSVANTNRNLDLNRSILPITNLTKEDLGDYNCTNNDVFGGSTTLFFLNVLYQPYETAISADTSKSVVTTDSGLLLNSTQIVTLHCTSDSNPKANCSFAPFSTWSESCSRNRDFTTSGSVSCSTNNGIGNTGKSQTLSVVVVEQRTSDVILASADEGSVQSGYDVTLNCSVAYQDELNTIFEWTIPSDRTIDATDSILTLNNLTRFDRGNYICQTKDDFGNSMKFLFLDVLYGASKEPGSKTTCTWSEVANNSCFLNFNSNPPTKDYSLSHEDTGEDATCQNCYFESIGSENVTQRFIFALPQTSNETASFNLRILSSGFTDLEVTFAISDGIPIDTGDDQTVVIIASVIGGILFIVIILAALLVMRRRGMFDKKEGGDINSFNNGNGVPTSNDPEIAQTKQDKKKKKEKKAKADKNPDVYTAVDISKKSKKGSEKEERLNPLYDGVAIPDQITDAYDTVDVNKNQSEKEDRINPLYDVGQGNGVEEAYASVDKTKKKKGKDNSSGKKKKGTAALLGFGAQNGNQDAYVEVDFHKKKKNKNKKSRKENKENKVNPSYLVGETDGTQDAYATVDISKKKMKEFSEKEDRLNPLYDVGQGYGIEDAYASVDKSAKRDTSEKEDRINPLYDSYQDQPSTSSSKSGTENKVAEGQDTGNDDVAEATYATLNKTKKMKKQNKVEDYSDANSSKSKKPPQTFKVMDTVVGDTYAVVKKDNTKLKGKKAEIENTLYDSYHDQPTTSGCNLDSLHASYTTTALDEVTYAVVDKSWKSAHLNPESFKPTLPKKPDLQQSSENYKPKIGKKPSSQ